MTECRMTECRVTGSRVPNDSMPNVKMSNDLMSNYHGLIDLGFKEQGEHRPEEKVLESTFLLDEPEPKKLGYPDALP